MPCVEQGRLPVVALWARAVPSCPARAACGREERKEGERGRKKKKEKEKEKEKVCERERERERSRRRDSRRRLRSDEHARRSVTRCEGKKGDGMVIEFGCRDRDSMGKVSGDLGFRDDLSPTIKGNFENYF